MQIFLRKEGENASTRRTGRVVFHDCVDVAVHDDGVFCARETRARGALRGTTRNAIDIGRSFVASVSFTETRCWNESMVA